MAVLLVSGNLPQRDPGDIIEIRANGSGFGAMERPPLFYRVNVPDAIISDFVAYQNKTWKCELDYEVLVHNTALDGYRIRVWNSTESVTDQGINYARLTRPQIENYINNWNGSVVDIVDGRVRFDIGIYQMVISEGFWREIRANLTDAIFIEISYDEPTGIHRVSCDYSALSGSPTTVEKEVENRGATIVSHADRVIVFDIQRNVVLQYFKENVKAKLESIFYKRTRHHITSTLYGTNKQASVVQSGTNINRISGDLFDSNIEGGYLKWDDANSNTNSEVISFIDSDNLTVKGIHSRSGLISWFDITNDESTSDRETILSDVADKVNE